MHHFFRFIKLWLSRRFFWFLVALPFTTVALSACSPKHLILQGFASEIAAQGDSPEDDLILAREASAFYLKLSESLLRQVPDNSKLSESVSAGFTQYAYAFVSFEAERIESQNSKASQILRERAAKLYSRANTHAMAGLEQAQPGFRAALESPLPDRWPTLQQKHMALAYWAATSWGGYISLNKDSPEIVADLPLAMRLARLAYDRDPKFGNGALASLMGTFEAASAGGTKAQALRYFDQSIAIDGLQNAAPLVAKAEGVALPNGNRTEFEALLTQALSVSSTKKDLQNTVMRERARWLLSRVDDLF
jgi:predicted anti-sigma-YlaC factor YlaD